MAGGGESEYEQSTPEGQQLGHLSEDQPTITSWLSVKHVVRVVKMFDEYKRWLVSEIGLGEILKLPMLANAQIGYEEGEGQVPSDRN